MRGPVARTALDRGFRSQIQLDCWVASMDQALVIRIVEEQLGHMEAVEEDIVAGRNVLAEHHMVAAHNGRKESVEESTAADHTERGQVHHKLGMEQLSTVLHSQPDGQAARASRQRRRICW